MALNDSQPYQQKIYPMQVGGLTTKVDPSVLSEVQYQRLVNCVSIQEGALRTRNGYRNISPDGIEGYGGTIPHIHSIARLATGAASDAENYRYIGSGEHVYRLTAEAPPTLIPSADTGNLYAAWLNPPGGRNPRWTGVPYKKTSSGLPYMYIASRGRMLKDPVTDTSTGECKEMIRWGIDRPAWPAQASLGGAGNLVSTLSPYSYVYTFRNPITGHESNPSQEMLHLAGFVGGDKWIETDPGGSKITVIVRSVSPDPDYGLANHMDPQISGPRNIVIYRQGGSFSDGLYRRVAIITAADPTMDTVFEDNVPDLDIAANPQVEFDNDRPVTSSLPSPFVARIVGGLGTEAGVTIEGRNKITVEVESGLPPGATDLRGVLYPGTTVRIGIGTDAQEFCTVASVYEGEFAFDAVCQISHAIGELVETDSRANTPCPFACVAFNSLFLAGDENNPNVLYKSKSGRPESFPAAVNLADGSPGSIEVGTPSDPIMNITEFNGNVLCLNRSHLYIVQVYSNGYMQEPVKTLAQRGLMGSWAWCKADNEIWYLAYDGIYSWSGGESVKRSEAIDPIFRGEEFNGFYPISYNRTPDANGLSDVDKCLFHYRNNQVFVTYVDTQGTTRRLRYDIIYNRWSSEDVAADAVLCEEDTGAVVFSTNAGGVACLNVDDSPVSSTVPSTTDGWSSSEQNDGLAINWEAWTGWYMMGMPSMQKQFGDVVVELLNVDADVTVEVFYDYASAASETFVIGADPSGIRRREVLSLRSAASQEAYAISLRFTGSSVQPVTLYSLTFNFLTLEQIQRGRASDWDNCGYPFDKRFQQVSFEFDVAGTDATVYVDTMGGIDGSEYTEAVQTLTLSSPASTTATGPLRGRKTFPLDDGIVAKLVRLRPAETSHHIKIWAPEWTFLQYPPDKVLFTEWDDCGYPCQKVVREMILEVDTGGTPATVNVQADGVTKRTFSVQTTMDARHYVVTLNRDGDSELIGRQFRLLNAPAVGGKFQLFKPPQFNVVREPCEVTWWDSLEQTFGYNGYKHLKQIWLHYRSCAPVIMTLYVDGGLKLLEEELPQHDRREVERIYVPVSNGRALNKSKTYRIVLASMDPCCPLFPYAESWRAEWMPVGADMRTGYQQSQWSAVMERVVMP